MKTKHDIPYQLAGQLGKSTIPAGTTVQPATNLPSKDGLQYWVDDWDGMTDKDRYVGSYGFLVGAIEVIA